MSSTNRGTVRELDDLYETPEWLTEAIMPALKDRLALQSDHPLIYEPACGMGRMVKVLEETFKGDANIVSSDINGGGTGKYPMDFLSTPPIHSYDLIITNPPYKHAMEFVQKAMEWRKGDRSIVALLLRLNFLGSQKRAPWLRDHPPAVYVTPKRPSFRPDNQTDSVEYAWFVWQEPFWATSGIHILETENIKTPKLGRGHTKGLSSKIAEALEERKKRNATSPNLVDNA